MKLGVVHPGKYNRCKHCKIVVSNVRHTMCKKCYYKKVEDRYNKEEISTVEEYFVTQKNNNTSIKHLGYVEPVKYKNNIRILSLNPRGFGPDNMEKIVMLKESKDRFQFDGVFFSSPDRHWNSIRKELMRRYLATIGRNVTINTSDTGIDPKTIRGYLPGGTMSAVWENLADLVVTTRSKD